jgi:DNA invertase Pin-like site-specific DNA recombinase
MIRPAIYTRVSTADQSTAAQLRDLRQYCKARERRSVDLQRPGLRRIRLDHPWAKPIEFTDHGISGAKDKRPGLDDLMKAVRAGKVNVVVVWRFDRFGRSMKHLVESLEFFRQMGVQFVSLQEQVDTTTAMGELFFMIAAAFAQFERRLIASRVQAGVDAARARGARLGRPPAVDRGSDLAKKIRAMRQNAPRGSKKPSWATIGRAVGVTESTARRVALGK